MLYTADCLWIFLGGGGEPRPDKRYIFTSSELKSTCFTRHGDRINVLTGSYFIMSGSNMWVNNRF